MEQVVFQPQPQIILTDDELFLDIIDKASNDKLEQYIKEIDDEKEMRKIKDKRMLKLKEELKKEKNKMLKEVKDIKVRMLNNLQAEKYDDGNDFSDEEEKVIKKKKVFKK
jgi:hypothetical protein